MSSLRPTTKNLLNPPQTLTSLSQLFDVYALTTWRVQNNGDNFKDLPDFEFRTSCLIRDCDDRIM